MDLRRKKVLELICSELSIYPDRNDVYEITLTEADFKRQGLGFDEACIVLGDLLEEKQIHDYGRFFDNEKGRGWCASFVTWHGIRNNLSASENQEEGFSPALYDIEKGVLHFKGKDILISARSNKTRAQYILEYLYAQEKPADQHFYSEINETIFPDENHDPRKYYRACEAIATKVLKTVGISDYLIFTSGNRAFVRINPRYLA